MPTWLAILLGILGSAGVFSFVEFLVKRHDTRKGTTSQIMTELKSLQNDIKALRDQIEENKAVESRRRILSISDELLHEDTDRRHSKEYFDQILDDITLYEKYCEAHKDFKNNKAVASITHIKKIYNERLEKKDFL